MCTHSLPLPFRPLPFRPLPFRNNAQRMKLASVWVGVLAFAACATVGNAVLSTTCTYRAYPANTVRPCGSTAYDPESQVCCDGTVHDRHSPHSEPRRCCGSEWVLDNQCCGGNPIVPEHPFDTIRCCYGKTTYDSLVARCCPDGTVLSTFDEEMECCYNPTTGTSSLYNTTSQQCCGGKVLDPPESGMSRLCCETAYMDYDPFVTSNLACCETPTGSSIYDTTTDICCTTQIRNRPDHTLNPNPRCCGDVVYNADEQVCCGNSDTEEYVVFSEKDDHTCCGTEYIATELSVGCCGNKFLYPYSSSVISCCIDTIYNTERHSCVKDSCRYCNVDPNDDTPCDRFTFGGFV